jgi:hypothetical protein
VAGLNVIPAPPFSKSLLPLTLKSFTRTSSDASRTLLVWREFAHVS